MTEQLTMSYEAAPATKMLATKCAMCGRPLLDAASVEAGLGPVCRMKSAALEADVTEEQREEGNRLIHRIAVLRSTTNAEFAWKNAPAARELVDCITRIRGVGLARLASVLEERLLEVRVTEVVDLYELRVPYRADFVAQAWRYGLKWNAERRAYSFKRERRADVYVALRRHFACALGRGPRGLFVVEPTLTLKQG